MLNSEKTSGHEINSSQATVIYVAYNKQKIYSSVIQYKEVYYFIKKKTSTED